MQFVERFPLVKRKDMDVLSFAIFVIEKTVLVSNSMTLITLENIVAQLLIS